MDPIIEITLVLGFSSLFLSAALHKLGDLSEFRQQLRDYELLPRSTVATAAIAIPILEGATAVALLLPATRRLGLQFTMMLLLVYTLAMAINILRGRRDIDCGCSGPAQKQPLSIALIARNVVLVAIAGSALLPINARPLALSDHMTIALALTTLMLLYATTNQLIANRSLIREMTGR